MQVKWLQIVFGSYSVRFIKSFSTYGFYDFNKTQVKNSLGVFTVTEVGWNTPENCSKNSGEGESQNRMFPSRMFLGRLPFLKLYFYIHWWREGGGEQGTADTYYELLRCPATCQDFCSFFI